jgi:hypothetical protein
LIDLRDVAVRVLVGVVGTEELPMIAARALAEGQDSPSLRELAGLSRRDHREAGDLLWDVLCGGCGQGCGKVCVQVC